MIFSVGSKRSGHFFAGRRMADLEEHAFKRDKRFVIRLVLTVLVALVATVFISGWLTHEGTAGCAAGAMLGEGASDGTAEPQKK
jgi:uncharacterized ion transporter superfamily protein YfcC